MINSQQREHGQRVNQRVPLPSVTSRVASAKKGHYSNECKQNEGAEESQPSRETGVQLLIAGTDSDAYSSNDFSFAFVNDGDVTRKSTMTATVLHQLNGKLPQN